MPDEPTSPVTPVVIVMGVSGSGKTSVGQAVANCLDWRFVDADDIHSPANVAKMRAGHGLTDADRERWLLQLNHLLKERQREGVAVVLACSALKQAYRQTLLDDVTNHQIVYLEVPQTVVVERISSRRGHFVNAELVTSQFADLEIPGPGEAITIDADRPKAVVVDAVVDALHRSFDLPVGDREPGSPVRATVVFPPLADVSNGWSPVHAMVARGHQRLCRRAVPSGGTLLADDDVGSDTICVVQAGGLLGPYGKVSASRRRAR